MIYRPDIDGLRTLAVVPVVLFHANVVGFSGGYIGVDVFFVISGFLITSIIQAELGQGDFSIVRFYERRARRILPALFAVMAASVVAGWFLLTPAKYEQLGESMLAALLFVSNFWFWQNSGGYFAGPTDYLPLLHTWSLAVEEQFYIFFPILMMVLYRLGRRRLIPAVVIVVLASLLLAVWATPIMPSAAFYLLPTRIWELGFGALLALGLVPVNSRKSIRELAATIGLLGILVPVFVYDRSTDFPGLAALPPVLGTALIIWAGIEKATWVSRFLAIKPMVWVGLLSYSLYLRHWPIMAFLRERLFTVHLEPIWQIVAIAASFALAWLSWRYIERPFRDRKQFKFSAAQIFRYVAAGSFTIFAATSALIYTEGAGTQRFSDKEVNLLLSATRDDRSEECFGVRRSKEPCVLGLDDPSINPKWLLWGDSHAKSLLPAFDELARKNGQRLIFVAAPSCPPLVGVRVRDDNNDFLKHCATVQKRALDIIQSNELIETIFIAARWPAYLHDHDLVSSGLRVEEIIQTDSADLKRDLNKNSVLIKLGLTELKKKTESRGRSLVIIGTVPELFWDLPAAIAAQALFNEPISETLTLSQVNTRQDMVNSILSEMASFPKTYLISFKESFCKPHCLALSEEAAYYRDSHHLTRDGAMDLAMPVIESFLVEMYAEN